MFTYNRYSQCYCKHLWSVAQALQIPFFVGKDSLVLWWFYQAEGTLNGELARLAGCTLEHARCGGDGGWGVRGRGCTVPLITAQSDGDNVEWRRRLVYFLSTPWYCWERSLCVTRVILRGRDADFYFWCICLSVFFGWKWKLSQVLNKGGCQVIIG